MVLQICKRFFRILVVDQQCVARLNLSQPGGLAKAFEPRADDLFNLVELVGVQEL